MLDSSTVTFIVILVTGFIFLRWFITSDDDEIDGVTNSINPHQERVDQPNSQPVRRRRDVNSDMIEVVKSIAPHLTDAQIKYDLERTGSVQDTVDRILSEGTLPFPPGQAPTVNNASGDARNKENNIRPENLLKKYGINENDVGKTAAPSNTWSASPDVRAKSLEEKKAAMILNARRRLEAQLKNEQDLSAL